MTDNPQKAEPPQPLDYRSPPQVSVARSCLHAIAIFAAVLASIFSGFAVLFMAPSQQWYLGVALAVGLLVITIVAIVAGKRWRSPAAALFIAAVCAFLLALGLCSHFRFER